MSVQLGEVREICNVLYRAKVNSLDTLRRVRVSADDFKGPQADYVKATLTVIMMVLAVVVSVDCARKWVCILTGRECAEEIEPEGDLMALAEGVEVSD